MRKRDVSVAVVVILAIGTAGWAYAEASIVGQSHAASSSATSPAILPVTSAKAVDADYAVPGLLDYRSWKAEYDARPGPQPSLAARMASRPAHRADLVPVTLTEPPSPDDGDTATAPKPVPSVILPSDTAPDPES